MTELRLDDDVTVLAGVRIQVVREFESRRDVRVAVQRDHTRRSCAFYRQAVPAWI